MLRNPSKTRGAEVEKQDQSTHGYTRGTQRAIPRSDATFSDRYRLGSTCHLQ